MSARPNPYVMALARVAVMQAVAEAGGLQSGILAPSREPELRASAIARLRAARASI